VDNLTKWLKQRGFDLHMSVGEQHTLIGLIGDTSKVDIDLISSLDVVDAVRRIQEPYKNANRKFHNDDTVIDVGCGSGILGISALKLGAGKAYLTDIDYVAVESAKHNCDLNGVAQTAIVAHSNLLDNADIKGDLMLANITAEVLQFLAPSIPKNLKEDGVLILSGIIESRLPLVKEAYGKVGMQIVRERKKGEWYGLVLRHKVD
jgi:ribosomal protein L11 methylase PrmA